MNQRSQAVRDLLEAVRAKGFDPGPDGPPPDRCWHEAQVEVGDPAQYPSVQESQES
ncbi:hypothetical protein [Nesterenkonia alkaliphila]|uniref:Uncharacterized protein n=1 Tax=Nesterenkonia alkaliphila TaxID=1463631 RepID=A0A7K1UGY4_9MICC|nr:hypothetical protein [Nesterenkonia alkaliphila]MVT25735.1 hypothetical protein [Nesterenkonia alkaliphila]GFZ85438.1 hypothetical protein GCM10011359_13220 [Nesterenkonia alkaliphila]